MKKLFCKNMPIDVTVQEYLELAKTLYASMETMLSKNKCYYFVCLSDKKVYLLDAVAESEKVDHFCNSSDYAILNII